MPFTPFHFGPGLLLKGAMPERFSFLAFSTTQVVIDLESWYYLTAAGVIGTALVFARPRFWRAVRAQ